MATREELLAKIRGAAQSSAEAAPSMREILQQRIAEAAVPPIPQPRGVPGPEGEFGVGRTARGALQLGLAGLEGGTLGLAPEVVAAGKAVAGNLGVEGQPTGFGEALAEVEETMNRIPAGTRTFGNLVGGAGLGSAGAVPRTLAQAAGLGAVTGGVAGLGFAEGGLAERAPAAALGAGLGGLGGAAGQGLAQGVGSLVARLRQGVNKRTAQAMTRVLQEMEAGDITPQQAIARVEKLGPEGVLADVPGLRRLAQQSAAGSTGAENIARDMLSRRAAAASGRVDQALDTAFGAGNVREVRNALLRARKDTARPLYQQALSGGPLRRTEALTELIGTPSERGIQGGSSDVVKAIRNLKASNPRFRGLEDTDPQLLHQVRTTLSEKSRGPGKPKANLNDIVQQLTDAMDDAGARGYRQATNQYRSDSLTLEAFDKGRKALNELPENIEAFLAAAPDGEKEAFVAGLARQVVREAEPGPTGNVPVNLRKIFRGERAQVLRSALGEDGYGAFRSRLLKELEFARTSGAVLGGSATQPRQAAAGEQFKRLGRVKRGLQAMRDRGSVVSGVGELMTAAQPSGTNPEMNRALAQLLFRSQGQGLGPQRFAAGQTPLTELALRQSLLQGTAGGLASLIRPGVTAGGVGAGAGAAQLLGGVEF